MGKIRVKTLGIEEEEKKQKKEAEKKQKQKKPRLQSPAQSNGGQVAKIQAVKKQEDTSPSSQVVLSKVEVTPGMVGRAKRDSSEVKQIAEKTPKAEAKKPIKKAISAKKRSNKYQTVSKLIEKGKAYPLDIALNLLPKLKLSNFDETVELHINTTETGISGNLKLPHGTGKKTRVAIADPSLPDGESGQVDALLKKIESGIIDFDVLIAHPSAMSKLAKVARILGPRGLMPNPKNGTITANPDRLALSFAKGQINFKTEKAPIIHLSVGKLSFGDKKLSENIKTAIKAISANKIKKVTLKSTMSPGLIINLPLD